MGGNLVQEEGEQISHIVWDNVERQAYKVRLTPFLMSTLGLWLALHYETRYLELVTGYCYLELDTKTMDLSLGYGLRNLDSFARLGSGT